MTFVRNNKQTSIRCNHTHNTHWVHRKCTQIKQRQYKPDWICTIHTPIQLVTTTPSTSNSPSPTKHHPPTNNNKPKDKNIVILQININDIRNKIRELKTRYTAHNQTPSQYKKLTQKTKTPKIPHYTTISTDREGTQTRRMCCCCLPTPMTLASVGGGGGVRCSRLWSTGQLLQPSGQQCSHSGGVCPQIQG